ncbi:LysE family transporter [Haladaptatus sp. F3-133]|uniref:LysE family transporter n=1 Tax=Halorutilus salinus TaxID=2487751 RepID=A0A9Q4C2T0_9EURY|nr:LysE family transporter [Halorutilus salinus]MCX2818263.1 LysE family transporter [Halorutilus salinus]
MSATASLVSLVVGGALAFSLVAPPGPMNALIADETAARGWFAGFRSGLGAFASDTVFCALALSGAVTVAGSPTVRSVAAMVGGVFMFYLAYDALRDARARTPTESRGFTKALVLGLTNPYQIGWWLTAGVALVQPSPVEVAGETVVVGGVTVLVGFFAGILVWITAFPALLVRAGDRLEGFEKGVSYVSAAVLSVFGVAFVYYAVL